MLSDYRSYNLQKDVETRVKRQYHSYTGDDATDTFANFIK